VLLAAGVSSIFVAGCGSGVLGTATDALEMQGSVQGGLQPVSGASVQFFAASASGSNTSAKLMSSTKISTSVSGAFSLPANFKCINGSDQIYVVATGGNPGGGNNSSLALMSDLGTCSNLNKKTPIYVNEVTTIASVYALAKFMNPSSFDVASSSSDALAVAAAYPIAGTLANLTTGSAISSNSVYKKLNSLADSLATCVNSTTNSSPCKSLFAAATTAGSTPPANTIAAILNIALHPTNNVDSIYNLASVLPFQPTLTASPADWTLFGSTADASVTATDPVITWATPSAVVYGTTLSATQLNATASVPGTFTYAPAVGTSPSVGSNTLTVNFTPNDTVHYNKKAAAVNLLVNKAGGVITWPTPAPITYGTSLSATQLNATASIPGSFVYDHTVGTTPPAGNSTLTVTFTPRDTVNYSVQTASVVLVVNKATPVVNWATPSSINSGTALSAVQLNATANTAGTFVYSPAAGTVLPTGTSSLSTVFTPQDAANYTNASRSVSIKIGNGQQTTPAITWHTPAPITYGTALSSAQLNATSAVPGTFSYSPAIGAVPAAGNDTLSVTFTPSDTTTYSTATATVNLVVNKGGSAITWATPAPVVYGTALSTAQLNATASVPGTFTYSPAAGATPAAGTNTLSVTFTPSDTATYSTSTATVNLQVDKATPTITWATPAAITYGTALSSTQLNATAPIAGSFTYTPAAGTTLSAGNQTLSVSFAPSDTSNYITATKSVTLNVSGGTSQVTWATPAAIDYGTALSSTQLNATASIPGTFSYSPATGAVLDAGTRSLSVTFTPTDSSYATQTSTVNLVVNKATPAITWANPASIAYGTALSSTQLNATSSVPGNFTYTPASGSVPATGTTTLSALFTPTDSANYTSATKTVSLTVGGGSVSISWPNPAAITYGTALSATQLNANSSIPGSFTYSPAIGTVLTAGTQTLTATFSPTDTTNYSTQTISASLVVNKAAPAITWATPSSIANGTALSSTQLNATASVPGAFVYSPAAGTILPAGTSTLSTTFTPTDTTNYSTQTATVSLVVGGGTGPITPTINWSTPAAITYGTALSSAQLNASASVPGAFSYNPAAGTVLAAGTRTLTVTFAPTDTSYSPLTASVTVVVSKANPAITWATPAAVDYGTALSSTQLNATASVPGTFSYSPASGTVLGTGTNTLSVTFNPTDASYASATATVALVVNKLVPTITWANPVAIASGTALSATQLNATASVPGSFVYSPAAGAVLSAGTNTLSVTFTPTDTAHYTTKTATVSLVVNGGAPTITWANPAAISYGAALSSTQLNATASAPGTFVYSPASGTVLGAGTQTLKVTYTPTDKTYPAQTATVSVVVNKAIPTITWGTPASIAVGAALSAAQLNATASVPGSFVYSPALGIIPIAGTTTLSVTFTPTDTANYNTATASVSLSVTGGSSSSATNIAIGTTAAQTGMKRFGMNIAGQSYYDSGQMLRNLVFRNPGFEGELWQTILKCAAVTATSCTDNNTWAQWSANFVQGASYEFIYGGALGQTGTITSSTVANSSQGVTINFAQGSKTPKVGDFVVVKMTVPGNPQAGWWSSVSGGATLLPEYSDLSPNTVGKQALRITAAGSGQSADLSSYFDSYNGRSFVQLNGSYKVAFRAKGVGGSNQLAVTFQRSTSSGNVTFLSQSVSLGSSWQDYSYTVSANETGSSIGTVKLAFDVSGASVLLDDVSITPATVSSSNPSPFRDEVVKALTDLHPGILRYWDSGTSGSTIDNLIAPPFARQRAGFSTQSTLSEDVAIGLPEFLQLCQTVGAEPYFNMPAGMSPTEMKNLVEYLGGDSSTPYGAKRAASGQAAPWTSLFPVIHLELGNEQWNSGVFYGEAINDAVAYGQRVAAVFAGAKASSGYNSSSFDLVLGSWAAVPWWTQQETANSSNYDSVSVAPYLYNSLNDTSSTEAIFGPMFAQPEQVDSISSGYMNQQVQAAKAAGTKVVVYEVNLSTLSGTANQATVNAVVPSVASGLAVAEHMLLMARDLGITTQNLWALPGYNNGFSNSNGGSESTPLFGSVIDMGGQSNLRRPTFLAEQLANTAILPTILTTTLSGANPTWAQALSTNDSIQLSAAHEIQSFAFTDGGNNRSVIVFNLSRTTARPVTFSGSNIPTGSVNLGQLTSANLTDTNETASNVKITNSTLSNFQSSTPYSLPPFSMTVFTWQQ
jgi:alpha-L-arabinofuranosidase